ncbi:MAG: hypothetical protein EAY70_01780 [Sphingomonadales bacterium]|nr:MAG: hypothetical protein EAY70_01780 [Sphingomonadales bacterium]
MTRALPLMALAMLGACVPASVPDAVGNTQPVASLVGEYRIAAIDGRAIDWPFGLTLSIAPDRIVFDGPCNGYAWDYRLKGQALTLRRSASPDPDCLARARIHQLVFDLATAVDAATSAGRDPSNAVILAGGEHQVTLYSQ